jgi:beta-glucanase (GH16 family)
MLLPLLLLATPMVARPQGTPDKAPEVARQAGYTSLSFDEEFFGTASKLLERWNLGLWFQSKLVSPEFSMQAGVIRVAARAAPALRNTFLTTPQSFGFGYFEARMRWPKDPGNWANFWLLSDVPPRYPYMGPWAPYCEIDIVEAHPKGVEHAVHDWKGNNNESQASRNNYRMIPVDPTQWHNYGVLRQQGQITFYIDGMPTWSSASPDVCDTQKLSIVFGNQRRDDHEHSAEFDWIRVWQ